MGANEGAFRWMELYWQRCIRFFKQENIDVSRCSEFDFKKRTRKLRQVKVSKKSQVQKYNFNAKTTTAEGLKDISNEVDFANKNQGNRDYDDGGFICDHAHTHPMIWN